MRFRGIHVMNHGSKKGSRAVARAIEASGVLRLATTAWHGHGVYGHFEQHQSLYEGKPYVRFEAEVFPGQVHAIKTVGDREFFVIRCDEDLPITIIEFHNIED